LYGHEVEKHVSGRRWLDAGSGQQVLPGLQSKSRQIVAAAKIAIAVDLDFGSLAKEEHKRPVVCADLGSLPFLDNAFNLVTCNMVVEHIVHPKQVMREFARVPAPAGVLVIHTPNRHNYEIAIGRAAKCILPYRWIQRLIWLSEHRHEKDVFKHTIGRTPLRQFAHC
jgi:ubiquinone/menaquinone biosynthesis C-methylase UbiE